MDTNDKQEIIKCPYCGEVMIHNSEHEFWKCPDCDSEFWPKVDFGPSGDLNSLATRAMIRQAFREDTKRGARTGGGRSGRRRKPRPKPIPITERYLLE